MGTDAGLSDHDLIVLPGLDGTTLLLNEVLMRARSKFASVQAIAYPPDQRLDYDQLEALVRQSLPSNRRFILLGESFSGPIAIAIAARPPADLAALVLTTSFARTPSRLQRPFGGLIGSLSIALPPMPLLSWMLFGAWSSMELQSELREALRSVDLRVLTQRARTALRADVTGLLADVRVPTLYLRGTGDRLISASTGPRLVAAIERAELVDIPGPHLLLQAAPEASLKAIVEFCRRLDQDSEATPLQALERRSSEGDL